MNPLATELNQTLQAKSPTTHALLSKRGQSLYFPKGILSQAAEARQKGHRFNASIGEATEGDGPMALDAIMKYVRDLSAADALRYAPAAGKPALRQAWRDKLLSENISLSDKTFGMPIVTSAITHGLSLLGDLFIDPGDRLLMPDKLWGNYRLTYEVRLGGHIETFPLFDQGGFNVAGLANACIDGPQKTVLMLNFPNNPTGYMPTRAEVEGMVNAVRIAAEAGKTFVVVSDDAYFGLFFDDACITESPFALFANLHKNVLAVKLDGATKELFAWGLRCGFITYAPPLCDSDEDAAAVLEVLEKKTMGAIRGSISNVPALSQSMVAAALGAPEMAAQRKAKRDILHRRVDTLREVVYRDAYRDSWDVYPFNAGYFMCIAVKGVDANELRVHLLDKYGVGLISIGKTDLRIAFSCLEEEQIAPLFEYIHRGIQDLRAG